MKTTSNNNEKKVIYLWFSKGKSHYYPNRDFNFIAEKTLPEVIEWTKSQDCGVEKEEWSDEKDCFVPLPEEEWALYDRAGNCILQGREYLESLTGSIELYGCTEIVTTNESLSDREKEALIFAYNKGESMSNELSEWIEENLLK